MNKNFDKLPKGWEETIAKAYADGYSDIEVKALLRMTTGIWDSLYNDPVVSSFKQIVDFGRTLSKAWWIGKARKNVENKQFNAALWYMVMKNQFGWSDKTTTTLSDRPELSSDDLDAQIQAAIDKYQKTNVR